MTRCHENNIMNDKEQVHDDYAQGGSIGSGNPKARRNMKILGTAFTIAAVVAFVLAIILTN